MGFMLKKPANEVGKSGPAILVGLFVAFGGVLFGYDTGTISGILAMDFFKEQFARHWDAEGKPYLTSTETSLIVSILSAGTFFGALGASFLADTIGRRLGLIISCLVFCVGVALQTAAVEQNLFVAGRAVAGFGVGLLSAIVPLYQSESAPKWIRGTIVGCYQWAITLGLFLASCANQGSMNRKDTGSYRIPIAIQFLWALILIIGMAILPETPRFLIMRDRYDDALKALSRLRKVSTEDPALIAELEEIQSNYTYEISLGKGTFADCFRSGIRKRLFTGCCIHALQQLTGINFIFYYGTHFFQQSGIKAAFTIALITNLVNICSTVPGLWLVEKAGRRPLLLWGAVGMCIFHFIVAIVGVATTSDVANNVLIAFVCLFIAFFAASWGPTAWVVTGEIFPLKIRAKGLSMAVATNWLFNWALAYATPYLVDEGPGNAALGSNVFFIWGGATFLCVLFVYFLIYETKGLSLEEVDELYQSVPSARASIGWTPREDYREAMEKGKIEAEHTEKAN
ncbi:general substrate transporter [Pyronema omphalodes]|nr:general substrate transporter [Pyronema omphalodes]